MTCREKLSIEHPELIDLRGLTKMVRLLFFSLHHQNLKNNIIGTAWLNMLRDNRRIENCVVINGRTLYSLVKTPVWECRGADADGEK